MFYGTHVVTGFTAGYLVGGDYKTAVISGIASLLADIDKSKSFIGNKFPVLSAIFEWSVGHRGPFHSLLAALIFYKLFSLIGGEAIGIGIVIGYIAHLVVDMFNRSGVPLFYPFPLRIRLWPFFQASGLMDKLVIFPAFLIYDIYLIDPSIPYLSFLSSLI